MSEICMVEKLGRVAYPPAREYQERLSLDIAAGKRPPTLLLLEHPHTYTFGRRGQAKNLLWNETELQRRGVSVYWVDRGGDVTYHGPGQLVGYPLLPLAPGGLYSGFVEDGKEVSVRLPQVNYIGYLRRLEESLIQVLDCLGVKGYAIPGLTGVWVSGEKWDHPAKIASIGVKVDARGVSRHGFALNIDPDMHYWQGIIGCGLADAPPACLADLLDPPPTFEQTCQALIGAFGRVFDYQMIQTDAASFLSAQLEKSG